MNLYFFESSDLSVDSNLYSENLTDPLFPSSQKREGQVDTGYLFFLGPTTMGISLPGAGKDCWGGGDMGKIHDPSPNKSLHEAINILKKPYGMN